MPQKKRKPEVDKLKPFFFGLIIGLVIILVTVMVAWSAEQQLAKNQPHVAEVSLGVMNYDFSSGKAVKRDDETTKSLKNFLQTLAKKDTKFCDVYYNVIAANSDETQVRVRYGCEHPVGSMFIVRDADSWKTISPTNHFDLFDIPECSYVDEHQIDKSIAPVCVNFADDRGAAASYSTR